MKYLIPLFIIFFTACSTQVNNGYQIKGKITGKTPAKAYLQVYTKGDMISIDSSDFTNGEFVFQGKVDYPERHYLKIGNNRPTPFFIENSHITISGNIDSLQVAQIEGSALNDKYDNFNADASIYDTELNSTYQLFRASEDTAEQAKLDITLDSIYEAKQSFIKEYVYKNSTCIIAAFLIRTQLIHSIELEELEKLTNSLSTDLKGSKYTMQLLERIDLLRKLQPGLPAPEFSQTNTNGETVNLSDLKGQYVLIDFWASWCVPCRKANPTVVEVYNKYNQKGFTVLGVSMDNDKKKWLKAIEDDKLTWNQVSTLEGWKNPAGKLYGVNSIPHAILINPEGNIVKRGIHANELDNILDSLIISQNTIPIQ